MTRTLAAALALALAAVVGVSVAASDDPAGAPSAARSWR